jgi:hypothetical protein
LGFCSLKGQLTTPKLCEAFDQEITCELTGNISMIVKKQWGKALYVKNIMVSLSGGDQYVCENVIVYCYDNQKGNKKQDISLPKTILLVMKLKSTVHSKNSLRPQIQANSTKNFTIKSKILILKWQQTKLLF